MGGEGSDRTEVYRLKGPPSETIALNIEIDATDKLEEGDTVTTNEGIYPILSALELLVYPTSASVIETRPASGRAISRSFRRKRP